MMGPKARPMLEVPARCTAKSALMMTMAMSTTRPWSLLTSAWPSGMVLRPSMAVVTVTAGVRMPSASSAAPPIMAGTMSHLAQRCTRL